MNAKNTEELVEIMMSSNKNILASFNISQNIGKMKEMIIEQFFNPQMDEIAEELNIKFTNKLKGSNIYSGFCFTVSGWEYFKIKFEFDGANYMKLGYMFSLLDDQKKPEESIMELYPKFSRHNQNKLLPCGWSYMSKFENWNEDVFVAIKSEDVKAEIKRVVEYMLELSKGLTM